MSLALKSLGPGSEGMAWIHKMKLGALYERLGRNARAAEVYSDLVAAIKKTEGPEPGNWRGYSNALSARGRVLAKLGRVDEADADFFARKIANIRLFADADGKTNLSILDVGGAALVISQFTLAADWRKGNRPGFSAAANPETAERLYEYLCKQLAAEGVPLKTGRFRSHMAVSLVNDGPMTIWMGSG